MRVGFLSGSLSRDGGGVFEIELALSQQLNKLAVEVEVFGTEDAHSRDDRARWHPIQTHLARRWALAGFSWSPSMFSMLAARNLDLVHLHTMWSHSSLVVQKWHAKTGKPYLLTPHGMLEPWALSNSRFKKQVASILYERAMVGKVHCLHANTCKELSDIRSFGITKPVAVIPNGVVLPSIENPLPDRHACKTMLFMGRLHPKKGLANLVKAWAMNIPELRAKGWKLVIAGWEQGTHLSELSKLVTELGMVSVDADGSSADSRPSRFPDDCDVVFLGPIFNEAKTRWLMSSTCFVLPSLSEGLPIAVLEAWAHELPVLMTHQCNLPEGEQVGAAIVSDATVESLGRSLNIVLSMKDNELMQMGKKGRVLVENSFSWEKVAGQMMSVYQWTLGGGVAPDCVSIA